MAADCNMECVAIKDGVTGKWGNRKGKLDKSDTHVISAASGQVGCILRHFPRSCRQQRRQQNFIFVKLG